MWQRVSNGMENTKNTLFRSVASDGSREIPRKIQFCNAAGQTSREGGRVAATTAFGDDSEI